MTAVICDLDGLLVDSEELHFLAYKSVLGEYGITLTERMFMEGWLSGARYGTRHYLTLAGFTDDETFEAARAKKSALFVELAKGKIKFMPGAEEFLKKVKQVGLPCGVGTGNYRTEYTFIFKECGLEAYVDAVVGGNDVAHNKPAPDIFLTVAERLGAKPAECVVFENSDIGVRCAVNAGMRCIVVPSPWTDWQDFSSADAVYGSLAEVDVSAL